LTTEDRLPIIKHTDRVECHSGYEYAQRPIAFYWEGDRLEIEEIIASWRHPDGKCFSVRAVNNDLFDLAFTLQYNQVNDQWRIQPR